MRTILFICANETGVPALNIAGRAGERDYMLALAAELAQSGEKSVQYRIMKIGGVSAGEVSDIHLPLTNAEYNAVALYTPDRLQGFSDEVHIMAVGNSTLSTALDAALQLRLQGIRPTLSYITHMIDNDDDMAKIQANDITVFTSANQQALQQAFPAVNLETIKLHILDAVPHTNTLASCQIEYEKMMQGAQAEKIRAVLQRNEPFACVILNAGFDVETTEGKKRLSYTPAEAAAQGAALGHQLAAGTHLVVTHGGPRNERDDAQNFTNTMDVFSQAYSQAQASKEAFPSVIQDPYQPHYNAVKAAYQLARSEHCVAFISNAEGYGTMDGAILLLDNDKILLGMLPFQAIEADTTGMRKGNLQKYNTLGLDLLTVSSEQRLTIQRNADRKKTPVQQRNPAGQILSTLGALVGKQPTAAPLKPTPRS